LTFIFSLSFWFLITINISYTLNFPASELQTPQLMTSQVSSHIEYLLQAYNIPVLILYLKFTKKIQPNDSFNTIL